MLFTAAILLPLIIGLFDVKAIELRGTEGSSNEKEFTSCSRGRSYHKLSANADSRSWSYSDADTGLKGVCSAANKCGPASWSKVKKLELRLQHMPEFHLILKLSHMIRSPLLVEL